MGWPAELLARFAVCPDDRVVRLANGMGGGDGHGLEVATAYWTRQWAFVDPHVEAVSFTEAADGSMVTQVRPSIRDPDGKPLRDQGYGLKDNTVTHVFRLQNRKAARFAIRDVSIAHGWRVSGSRIGKARIRTPRLPRGTACKISSRSQKEVPGDIGLDAPAGYGPDVGRRWLAHRHPATGSTVTSPPDEQRAGRAVMACWQGSRPAARLANCFAWHVVKDRDQRAVAACAARRGPWSVQRRLPFMPHYAVGAGYVRGSILAGMKRPPPATRRRRDLANPWSGYQVLTCTITWRPSAKGADRSVSLRVTAALTWRISLRLTKPTSLPVSGSTTGMRP